MARRLTCLALITAIWCTFAGVSFAQDNYQFSDPNVQDIFRYARMAVGGGVAKVKALELKGKSKVDLNGSLVDCILDFKR